MLAKHPIVNNPIPASADFQNFLPIPTATVPTFAGFSGNSFYQVQPVSRPVKPFVSKPVFHARPFKKPPPSAVDFTPAQPVAPVSQLKPLYSARPKPVLVMPSKPVYVTGRPFGPVTPVKYLSKPVYTPTETVLTNQKVDSIVKKASFFVDSDGKPIDFIFKHVSFVQRKVATFKIK